MVDGLDDSFGVGVAAVFLFALLAARATVRIVSQATRGSSSGSAATSRTLDPGLHFLFPFSTGCGSRVDLREQVVAFPPQPVITQDNVTISIDTVFYFTITDPFRATYEVRTSCSPSSSSR